MDNGSQPRNEARARERGAQSRARRPQVPPPSLQLEQWASLVDALAVAEFTRAFSAPLELAPHSLQVRPRP